MCMKPITYANVKTLFTAIFKYLYFSVYKNIISPLNNEISIFSEKHNFNFNLHVTTSCILQDYIYYLNVVLLYCTVLPLQIALCHLATAVSIQATRSAHIVSCNFMGY